MEGIQALDGVVAKVISRYHPGLIATISEIALMDQAAYVMIRMLSLVSMCLLL